jgi:ectoine hydroxylase-related dioxygenase (phytanoyl-CoA dioxygenase family)
MTAQLAALLPTDADVEHYRTNGWWVSGPVLGDDVIEAAVRGAQRIYAGEYDQPLPDGSTHWGWTPEQGVMVRKNDYTSLLVDDLRAVTTSRIIGAIAARLAGVDGIRLWHDQLLYKPPVPAEQASTSVLNVGWHTDRQYWMPATSERMLTAWVPFHDITHEHGPVMFVDGSHRWDEAVVGNFFDPDMSRLRGLVRDHEASVSEALVPRGGISFHNCRTIHGSGPNTSGQPRRAIAVHLQDVGNRYQRHVQPDGTVAMHPNERLVRRTASDEPDFADPRVCPTLWP